MKMKTLRIFLITFLMSMLVHASYCQHSYLAIIKDINNADTAKCICDAFTNMSATSCIYSESTHYFKIKTKNMLPSVIVEDYLTALGYKLIMYVEVEDRPQIFKMPTKKDTIMAN